jgi:hypothetical protein
VPEAANRTACPYRHGSQPAECSMSPQAKGSVQVRSSLNKRRNDVGPRSELRARMCSTLLMLLSSILDGDRLDVGHRLVASGRTRGRRKMHDLRAGRARHTHNRISRSGPKPPAAKRAAYMRALRHANRSAIAKAKQAGAGASRWLKHLPPGRSTELLVRFARSSVIDYTVRTV